MNWALGRSSRKYTEVGGGAVFVHEDHRVASFLDALRTLGRSKVAKPGWERFVASGALRRKRSAGQDAWNWATLLRLFVDGLVLTSCCVQ
jgi:hypothetical protein